MKNLTLFIIVGILGVSLAGCATTHSSNNSDHTASFIGGYYGHAAGFPPPHR